jgi:TonB family protein
VEPVYPPAAKSSRLKGTVRFRATLGEDGAFTSLPLVNGHPMLVNAARTAVSQWLYNPWTANGKQVEISTTIDVDVK